MSNPECRAGCGYICRCNRLMLRPNPQQQADALYEAIKHGDEKHRAWLREAIDAFFQGRSVPAPY